MFTCNSLTLLTFTYYLKLILAICMTIIPLMLFEIIFIKLIRYKQKNKKLNIIILKKQGKVLFYGSVLFILSFLLHTALNNQNNICYTFAKTDILNEYKLVYHELKQENLDESVKEQYLENVLLTTYNKLNTSNNNTQNSENNNKNNIISLENKIEDKKENNFLNETDKTKQNNVYVINGTFYYPKYVSGNRNTYSGMTCPSNPLNQGYNNKYGYNNYFYTRLMTFIDEASKNGHKITISSQGCRTYQTQVNYYNTMTKGRAAYPGQSLHGYGIASDLEFYQNDGSVCGWGRTDKSCPSMGWAHQNAYKYGLTFPLLNASYKEDWHIEPINKIKY